MNIKFWSLKQKPRSGYVLVNMRTSGPLYFTGLFGGNGRIMSREIEDVYVFNTRPEAKYFMTLNTLVDDLDVQSVVIRHQGFGARARKIAHAILDNQLVQDIAGLASLTLFAVNGFVWLAILSSMRGM